MSLPQFECNNPLTANELNQIVAAILSLQLLSHGLSLGGLDNRQLSVVNGNSSVNLNNILPSGINNHSWDEFIHFTLNNGRNEIDINNNPNNGNNPGVCDLAIKGDIKLSSGYGIKLKNGNKTNTYTINSSGLLCENDSPLIAGTSENGENFIHFGYNINNSDYNFTKIPSLLMLSDYDETSGEEDINNNYYDLYSGGIFIRGVNVELRGNYPIESDEGEYHTLFVRNGKLLFDGDEIGVSNSLELSDVLDKLNTDLQSFPSGNSAKYIYYDGNNFTWSDGTGTGGNNNVIGLPTGSTSNTSHISLNTNTLSIKSGEGISLTSNTTSFRNIADLNEEVSIIESTSSTNGRKLFINSGNEGVYIDKLYLYDNQGHTIQITGNGTGVTSLSGLSDTTIGASGNPLSQGLVLTYNGSKWVNGIISSGNLPAIDPSNDSGKYLVIDGNGIATWTNTTSNIADIYDSNTIIGYNKTYKLKTSNGSVTGNGITINTLAPAISSLDNALMFPDNFSITSNNGSLINFPIITASKKIRLTNTASSGNTGYGKITELTYDGNNINIKTYANITDANSGTNNETAGTAKLYLNGTELGSGESITDTNTTYKLTINGSTIGDVTNGTTLGTVYSPTTFGTLGYYLKSGGNNTAPSWQELVLKIEKYTLNTSPNITLQADTKYQLTVGDKTYLFKTPTDLTGTVGTGGITTITVGNGLNTTSENSTTNGGSISSNNNYLFITKNGIKKDKLNDDVGDNYVNGDSVDKLVAALRNYGIPIAKSHSANLHKFLFWIPIQNNTGSLSSGTYSYVKGTVAIYSGENIVNPIVCGTLNGVEVCSDSNGYYWRYDEDNGPLSSGFMVTSDKSDRIYNAYHNGATYTSQSTTKNRECNLTLLNVTSYVVPSNNS